MQKSPTVQDRPDLLCMVRWLVDRSVEVFNFVFFRNSFGKEIAISCPVRRKFVIFMDFVFIAESEITSTLSRNDYKFSAMFF